MFEAPTCDPGPRHPSGSALAGLGRLAGSPPLGAPLPAAEATPVATIMSTDVVSFSVDDSLVDASRIMLDRGVSGAPVLDGRGRPVGMVSKSDLLEAWMAHRRARSAAPVAAPSLHRGGISMPLGSGFHLERPTEATVGQVMAPFLLAVPQTAPIGLAAALMAYEGVHRLLVLDRANQMVGIVAAVDVLRWMAQLSGLCLPLAQAPRA